MTTAEPRKPPAPVREVRDEDMQKAFPLYAVWEITMHCDQPCQHCGTRAGRPREEELSWEKMCEVADALVRLGSREITLIGGEAYLHPDAERLTRYIADQGVRVTMQTGGRGFNADRAKRFADAGLSGLGVSIDGPARAHDTLRGNQGSHQAAMKALRNAREAGMVISSNTQINKLNCEMLEEHARTLRDEGVQAWQVQLTGPLGRAADHPEWIIDPWQIVPIIDTLAKIQRDAMDEWRAGDQQSIPFNVFTNNNIGYFGPHEQVLRSRPFGGEAHWQGCHAGKYVIGIESDGAVKACPTLPTSSFTAGNVRDAKLEHLWEHAELMRFTRDRTVDQLWGFCRTCYYAETCHAGCNWTAHTTLGKRGNMPFCYHRVTQLKRKGIRERLVPVEKAPGRPYDHGRFVIEEEPWPEVEPVAEPPAAPPPGRRFLPVVG